MTNKIERSLSYLGFIQVQPSAKLAKVIDCYWFLKTDASTNIDSREYLHPNGGMGIVLNFADPILFGDYRHADTCIFNGTSTFTKELREPANNNLPSLGAYSYIPFTQYFRPINPFFVKFHLFWQ